MSEPSSSPPPACEPPTPLGPQVETDAVLGSKRAKKSFWQRIGASGLSVSVAFHALLVFVAAAYVVSTVTDNAKKDPNIFTTGAGGGSGGERVKTTQHKIKPKNVKTLAKTTTRITSKSASASIALPDMPNSASVSSMVSGMMAGGSSKGFGGGAGGGIGTGKGMGSGGGKNFVSKPVMGANIFSQRLAVYFDASASMLPYLDRVEAAIREQFADADVFLSNGVFVDVHDNEIVGGDKFKGTPFLNRPTGGGSKKNAKGELVPTETNPNKLTQQGKALLNKYGNNFKTGSVGGWLDIMKDERTYDALIIFSDFQDGVRQIRTKAIGGVPAYKADKGMRADPPTVFTDRTNQGGGFARSVTLIASGASGQAVVQCKETTGLIVGMIALGAGIPQGTTVTAIQDNVSFTLSKPLTAMISGRVVCNNGGDKRFPEERKWEDEWIKAFAGARENKGPRLYLISTSRAYGNKPGTILQRCVAASEGTAIMVKFGSGKSGGNTIDNLHNYDDLYVGMPVSGKGVAVGATLLTMPTFKNIPDPDDPDKKRQLRVVDKQLAISAPLTADSVSAVFAFAPLIQAVGSLAKDSKTIDDVSGSIDLTSGMVIMDGRFPPATKVVAVVPNKLSPGFFTVEMSAPANAGGANTMMRFRPADSSAGNNRGGAPSR